MATEVIKTLRSAGGDYTTVAAFYAGEVRDLVSADEIAVLECYNDWPSGNTGETGFSLTGWASDATRYVHIRAAPGHQHTGKSQESGAYTGAAIVADTARNAMAASLPHSRITGLILEIDTADASSTIFTALTGGENSIFRDCIANVRAPNLTNTQAITQGFNGSQVIVNCLIEEATMVGIGVGFAFAVNSRVLNCTVANAGNEGFVGGTDDSVFINCLAHNCGDGFDLVNGVTVENCATDDNTLPAGNGNRNSQTFSFQDAGNRDFRLTGLDTGARGYGQDLSAYADYPFDADIVGNPRGETWDIGAFQYVGASVDPIEDLAVDDATPSVTCNADVGDVHFVTVEYGAAIDQIDLENLIERGIPE